MSKKVAFTMENMNAEARELFANFDEADKLLVLKGAEYKSARAVLEAAQEEALNASEEAKTPADKAAKRAALEAVLVKLSKLDKEYREDPARKEAQKAKKAACAVLPECLYEAYTAAWESGADGKLGTLLADTLVGWGFPEAKNSSAAKRFASVLKGRIGGSRKASAKIRDKQGVRVTAKGAGQFKEVVMLALLDMLEVPAK